MNAGRSQTVPNANSPRLLGRLVDHAARGIRSHRALQEALGVDLRTVQYYTQAGEWLGLFVGGDEAQLTPLGLELAYAGRRRPEVYARAVRAQPFVASLLSGRDALPPAEDIARAIAEAEPELAPATVLRRASAVRSLVAPAIGRAGRGGESDQLALPLALRPAPVALPRIDLDSGREYNPDVYRFLLATLLDHGELSLGCVRGLLDRAEASTAPIGGYVDLAVRRGDATRLGDRLVATRGVVDRRELVETATSIVLSDAGYRAYLADVRAAPSDPGARVRRDSGRVRYRGWDRRLLGHDAAPETLDEDLGRALLDRSLEAFPLAAGTGEVLATAHDPFLDVWERPGLPISLPPYLAGLTGGLGATNRALKAAREAGGHGVGAPDLSDRPAVWHGGLLHPGEPLPRSVPDVRSLRIRALLNAPYPSLIAALLLLHRQEPGQAALLERRGGWEVRRRRDRLGPVLDVLDGFALARGWVPCRRRSGGLGAGVLVEVLDALGVVARLPRQAVLAESFFGQLRTAVEEMEVAERLAPLAEALAEHLETVPAAEAE